MCLDFGRRQRFYLKVDLQEKREYKENMKVVTLCKTRRTKKKNPKNFLDINKSASGCFESGFECAWETWERDGMKPNNTSCDHRTPYVWFVVLVHIEDEWFCVGGGIIIVFQVRCSASQTKQGCEFKGVEKSQRVAP